MSEAPSPRSTRQGTVGLTACSLLVAPARAPGGASDRPLEHHCHIRRISWQKDTTEGQTTTVSGNGIRAIGSATIQIVSGLRLEVAVTTKIDGARVRVSLGTMHGTSST